MFIDQDTKHISTIYIMHYVPFSMSLVAVRSRLEPAIDHFIIFPQDRINTIKKPSFYHFYGKILPAYTI